MNDNTPSTDAPMPHRADTPERSEAEQLAFFESAFASVLEASKHVPVHEVLLDLAETIVAVRFVGEALADALLPAIAHLVVDDTHIPLATFHVWDSASSGVSMAPPPCPRESFTHRGDIWGMGSARIRSAFHWHEFSVNLFDHHRNTGIFWVQNASSLPYWSKASPLRTLFHWWLAANGAHLLHAAAVGTADGGLLLAGRGGTGKSTTALACLDAGMQFIGDDYLAVRIDPEPVAYSLYATAKVVPSQIQRFPALADYVVDANVPDGEKSVLRLYPAFANIVKRLPLRAVASPAFGSSAESSFEPDHSGSTRRSAAFTTLSQLPHAGRELHAFVDRLIDTLPNFTLRLGHAIPQVPVAIVQHLALSDAELQSMARAATPGRTRPVVSVVIPVFNGSTLLAAAVRSVLAQSWSEIEIVIVDDGSSDDIQGAVDTLPVDVLFIRQANAGPAAARNRGIGASSGDYIAFLDVDDLWTPDHLEALYAEFRANPSLDVSHGLAQVTTLVAPDSPGEYLGNPRESFPHYIGAGLYRRVAFEKIGVFDTELRFGEDTDWFQRARSASLRIAHLEEVTLFVRRHERNSTRGKTLHELNALRVLKKHLDRQRREISAKAATATEASPAATG